MKIRSCITALTLPLLLTGCQTMNTVTDATQKFKVEIVSKPAGAAIEINDDLIGKTPMTVEIEGWKATRTFIRSHRIVAHPVRVGGQTQIKSFIGWHEPSKQYGDPIPKKMYFNMGLIRAPQQHDIRINK